MPKRDPETDLTQAAPLPVPATPTGRDTEPAPAPKADLPEVIPPEGETIEEHAAAVGTHPATFAAMKAYFRFGEGRRMSREHYELAVAKVENLQFQ